MVDEREGIEETEGTERTEGTEEEEEAEVGAIEATGVMGTHKAALLSIAGKPLTS